MEKKQKNNHRVKFSKIACFILFILLLCAAPCSAQDPPPTVFVKSGETVNIDYGVSSLIVMSTGTANLYPGAYVYGGITALGGSIINFYGGEMGGENYYILAFSNGTNPQITVHGTNFAVNGKPLDPSATSFTLDLLSTYHELTGVYGNGDTINLKFRGNIPINLVTVTPDSGMVIDIKPGNEQNNINLKSNGVVPVAALTTGDFDTATIDPTTAIFAGASPSHWSTEDIDHDGDDDIIFHFRTQELDLDENSTEATLTAQLMSQMKTLSAAQASSGAVVSGTDTVKIVSAKKSKK